MDERIDRIYQELCRRLGAVGDWKAFTKRYDVYLGEGFAVPTEASYEAVEVFASNEALLLETTYTAKTFGGALDLVRTRVIPAGEACCVLHTGGVPALYGQAAEVAEALRPESLPIPSLAAAGAMERMKGVVSQLVDQISVLQQRVVSSRTIPIAGCGSGMDVLCGCSRDVSLRDLVRLQELLTEVSKEVLLALPSQEDETVPPEAELEKGGEATVQRGFAPFRGQAMEPARQGQGQGQGVDWEQEDQAAAAAAGLEGPSWEEPEQSGGHLVQLEDGSWVQPSEHAAAAAAAASLPKRTFAPFRGAQPPQPKL